MGVSVNYPVESWGGGVEARTCVRKMLRGLHRRFAGGAGELHGINWFTVMFLSPVCRGEEHLEGG